MRRSLLLSILSLVMFFALLVMLFFSGYKIHRQSAKKLLQATDTLMIDNQGMHLMDSALFTLNDAENNFRLYTVVYERKYLETFSRQLGEVLAMVDTISASLNMQNNKTFDELIRKKEDISGRIGQLIMATDSMLSHSIKNEMIEKLLHSIPVYDVRQVRKEKVTLDTLNSLQQTGPGKKGIIKRLGNALANRNDTVKAEVNIIVRTRDGHVLDKEAYDAIQLRRVITDVNGYYMGILKKELTNRLKLSAEESSLAGTNIIMMEELKALLISLREEVAVAGSLKKEAARDIAKDSAGKMKNIAFIGLVALLICIAVIVGAISLVRKNNSKLKAGKMAAEEQSRVRTDFLNNMSHEMRTPLNSVAGFTEQLLYTPLNREQKELVSSIGSATDMLIQVVNDVLDFSKMEHDYISLSPQPFIFYQAFSEVMEMMRVQAVKKKLTFNVSFGGDWKGQVNGDIFRLKQILLNLVSNAIKYTDRGGITIRATLELQDETQWLFSFTIRDTGEGISPEAQKHLFERFFQATPSRSSGKGTGLGLAITKRLIVMQGGDISYTSEVNKGSEFVCHIPYTKVVIPLAEITGAKEIQEKPGAFMEGRYVLIADDQELNLILLKLILTRWKCRFDMATDGEIALELFHKHNYDLVLLDLHMPRLTGIEVLEHIRKDKDPVKAAVVALALTANITADDESAFRKVGFNDWLLKPFKEREIYEVIMKHLPAITS